MAIIVEKKYHINVEKLNLFIFMTVILQHFTIYVSVVMAGFGINLKLKTIIYRGNQSLLE